MLPRSPSFSEGLRGPAEGLRWSSAGLRGGALNVLLSAIALVAVAAGAGCSNDPLPIYTPNCIEDGCESGTCYRYASRPESTDSFCTADCNTDAECPFSGYCFEIAGDPNRTKACFAGCTNDLNCEDGWLCTEAIDADTGAVRGNICLPPP